MAEDMTMQLIADVTVVIERMAALQELTLELVKIATERVENLERHAQGLSFEDMVDGRTPPPVGINADQKARLEALQAKLEEHL